MGIFVMGGKLTRDMFNTVITHKEVIALLDDLEVHVDHMELFDVLDADGNNEVDTTEFISGILKLRSGGADKSDMVAAILGIRALQNSINVIDGFMKDLKMTLSFPKGDGYGLQRDGLPRTGTG